MKAAAIAAAVLLFVAAGTAHGLVEPELPKPPSGAARLAVALARVQDSLAQGNRTAAAMQGRLLSEISRVLRSHGPQALPDGRTLRAGIIYLLSGGRPDDVAGLLRATPETEPLRWLLKGAAHFARGEREQALAAFEPFDAGRQPASIAGRIALAQAMSLPDSRMAERVRLLRLAARLMPGTLVEESALRRLVAIAAMLPEPQPLTATVKQYLEKYRHSVYAPELLKTYGTALAGLEARGKAPDRLAIEVTLNLLPAGTRRDVYLDIARQAMPKGLADLTLFAAARARRLSAEGSGPWHHATLYDAAVLIAGPDYDIAADLLARVDPRRLDPQGRALYDASRKLAESIRAPNGVEPISADAASQDEGSAIAGRAARALQSADDMLKGLTQ